MGGWGGGRGEGYSWDIQLVLPAAAVWMSLTRRSALRGPVKLQHPQRANVTLSKSGRVALGDTGTNNNHSYAGGWYCVLIVFVLTFASFCFLFLCLFVSLFPLSRSLCLSPPPPPSHFLPPLPKPISHSLFMPSLALFTALHYLSSVSRFGLAVRR